MHLQQCFAVNVYSRQIFLNQFFKNITALQPCWSVMPLVESVFVTNDKLDILCNFVFCSFYVGCQSRLSELFSKQGL